MRRETLSLGRRGEELAAGYLEQTGHRIVARNWRSGHLELDIVSLDVKGLHFVEVKSRRRSDVDPTENFTQRKKDLLVRSVGAFLNSECRKALPGDYEVYIDLITIVFDDDKADIHYFPQVIIPIYT